MGFPIPIHQADRRYPTTATNAYAASAVVSATGPGWLRAVYGYNSGAAQFIQIHDAAALPANGVDCLFGILVPASSPFSIAFGEEMKFENGIVLCNSSTNPAKTIGAADVQFLCNWRLRA